MKIFAISDTHFFHENCIKYNKRPFCGYQDMNEHLIENWNSTISEEDVVFHLGDVTAGLGAVFKKKEDLKELLLKLNGKKFLTIGNHDHYDKEFYTECGFESADYFILNDIFFNHYPIFWGEDYDSEAMREMKVNRRKIYQENGCKRLFYGHSHATEYDPTLIHKNFCVDLNGFRPIEITDFFE